MSQITHQKTLPKNIDYWDYFILCRGNDAASKIMQRMEYWDGTKAAGNVHGEQINDQLGDENKIPTQDTSRYIYKSREELAWELIGACSERTAYECLDYIIKLQYLKSRHNPYKTFDRTLQYEFQYETVQAHIDQLYAIIKCFTDHGRQQRPVLYAIECLTTEGVYVNRIEQKDGTLDGKDTLTIALVAERLTLMHEQMHIDEEEAKKKLVEGQKKYKPLLPTFVKSDLKKDEIRGFSADFPLCKNAQCIHTFLHNASIRFCTIDCANKHSPLCKNIRAIPITTTVTTNNDYNNEKTDIGSAERNVSLSLSDLSLEELQAEVAKRQAPQEQPAQPAKVIEVPDAAPAKEASKKSPLTAKGQHIKALWKEKTGRNLAETPANVKALNGLGEVAESDADFTDVYIMMKNHPFYKQNNVRIDVDFMFRKWDGFIGKVDDFRKVAAQEGPTNNQSNSERQLSDLTKRSREMAAKFSRKNASGQ